MQKMKHCQTCGYKERSLSLVVYCAQCELTMVHRYCMDGPLRYGDEEIKWVCEECEPRTVTTFKHPSRKSERLLLKENLKAKKTWKKMLCGDKHGDHKDAEKSTGDVKRAGLQVDKLQTCICDDEPLKDSEVPQGMPRLTQPVDTLQLQDQLLKDNEVPQGMTPLTQTVNTLRLRSTNNCADQQHELKTKESLPGAMEKVGKENSTAYEEVCVESDQSGCPLQTSTEQTSTETHEDPGLTLKKSCIPRAHQGTVQSDRYQLNPKVDGSGTYASVERFLCRPIFDAAWRGTCRVSHEMDTISFELEAHLSIKASSNVSEAIRTLPMPLDLVMVHKSTEWPKTFSLSPPTGEDIGIYFFPVQESDRKLCNSLLGKMMVEDLVLRFERTDLKLLVFTSLYLPQNLWRFNAKYYLWGVFCAQSSSSSSERASTIPRETVPNHPSDSICHKKVLCKNTSGSRSPTDPLNFGSITEMQPVLENHGATNSTMRPIDLDMQHNVQSIGKRDEARNVHGNPDIRLVREKDSDLPTSEFALDLVGETPLDGEKGSGRPSSKFASDLVGGGRKIKHTARMSTGYRPSSSQGNWKNSRPASIVHQADLQRHDHAANKNGVQGLGANSSNPSMKKLGSTNTTITMQTKHEAILGVGNTEQSPPCTSSNRHPGCNITRQADEGHDDLAQSKEKLNKALSKPDSEHVCSLGNSGEKVKRRPTSCIRAFPPLPPSPLKNSRPARTTCQADQADLERHDRTANKKGDQALDANSQNAGMEHHGSKDTTAQTIDLSLQDCNQPSGRRDGAQTKQKTSLCVGNTPPSIACISKNCHPGSSITHQADEGCHDLAQSKGKIKQALSKLDSEKVCSLGNSGRKVKRRPVSCIRDIPQFPPSTLKNSGPARTTCQAKFRSHDQDQSKKRDQVSRANFQSWNVKILGSTIPTHHAGFKSHDLTDVLEKRDQGSRANFQSWNVKNPGSTISDTQQAGCKRHNQTDVSKKIDEGSRANFQRSNVKKPGSTTTATNQAGFESHHQTGVSEKRDDGARANVQRLNVKNPGSTPVSNTQQAGFESHHQTSVSEKRDEGARANFQSSNVKNPGSTTTATHQAGFESHCRLVESKKRDKGYRANSESCNVKEPDATVASTQSIDLQMQNDVLNCGSRDNEQNLNIQPNPDTQMDSGTCIYGNKNEHKPVPCIVQALPVPSPSSVKYCRPGSMTHQAASGRCHHRAQSNKRKKGWNAKWPNHKMKLDVPGHFHQHPAIQRFQHVSNHVYKPDLDQCGNRNYSELNRQSLGIPGAKPKHFLRHKKPPMKKAPKFGSQFQSSLGFNFKNPQPYGRTFHAMPMKRDWNEH